MKFGRWIDEVIEYKIYCDMDGVLTDWNEAINRLDPNFDNIPTKKEKWDKIDAEGVKFWSNMKWLKDGRKLWNYIKDKNVKILSAHAKNRFLAIEGKKDWLRKNIGAVVAKQAIITAKDKKKNYSDGNSILIDDREDNIKEWKSKSGIGILYKSATNTIKQLKRIGI